MKLYKRLTIISGIISTASIVICLLLHYSFDSNEAEFWVNFCLALFGSALLTSLTAIMTYFYERKKTLESFMYHSKQLLHKLNKYDVNMSLENKISFFLDYNDFDTSSWDSDYGNMNFFFDRFTGNSKYIYQKIYLPIQQFNHAVANREWNFRWYLDGSGKNDVVVKEFISELEEYLVEHKQCSEPIEFDESGKAISFCKTSEIGPKLVFEILKQLNGHYYDIIYGKRVAKKNSYEELVKNRVSQ